MIGIILDTTAHPTGIIGNDSTNHAGIQGGGIRSNFTTIWCQPSIDLSSNQARLQVNGSLLFIEEKFLPIPTHFHQNTIRDGLA